MLLRSNPGRFAEADGGTIFLDEVGELSPMTQVKLLRVLQEGEIQPVGSALPKRVDVRVIAATNQDLGRLLAQNRFRADLYYRLNVFPILAPPLRERGADVLLLADHFVQKYAAQTRKAVKRISTAAIDLLMAYPWPGNVRELENCIEERYSWPKGTPSKHTIFRPHSKCGTLLPASERYPAGNWANWWRPMRRNSLRTP